MENNMAPPEQPPVKRKDIVEAARTLQSLLAYNGKGECPVSKAEAQSIWTAVWRERGFSAVGEFLDACAALAIEKEKDMSGSVNRVIIIGNLGRDPEVRTFQNGGKVCNLRIATSETWKDKASGERKERTEWHSVAIMSEPLAKIAEQFLRKGSKVYIEGQLETRKWQDQSGADKYSTEVVLRPFNSTLTMLDGPNRDGDQGNSGYQEPQGNPPGSRDMADDIPFSMEWRA